MRQKLAGFEDGVKGKMETALLRMITARSAKLVPVRPVPRRASAKLALPFPKTTRTKDLGTEAEMMISPRCRRDAPRASRPGLI